MNYHATHELSGNGKLNARFFQALDVVPTPWALIRHADGLILAVNESLLRALGYTREELVGETSAATGAFDELHNQEINLELESQERIRDRKLALKTKSGEKRFFLTSLAMTELASEPCVLATFAEEALGTSAAEPMPVGESRVLEMIAKAAPLTETLTNLACLIESQADGMLCSILVMDEDGEHLRHGAAPSLPAAYIKATDGARIGPAAGSCGTAMFRNETVIVSDILTDPLWADYRDLASTFGLRACWSVPIRSHLGKVLGSFAMYYREVRTPTNAEKQLLDRATHIAGIAMQRYLSEESLRKAEQKYRSIFENAVEGIFQSTPAGQFLTVNPALARMLGYQSPEELIATMRDIGHELYVEAERRLECRATLAEHGVVHGFECQFYRRDRSKIWVSLNTRAVFDAARNLLSYEGTVEEITERKRLEEQFRQAQKMEAIGQLAGGVAHDFNNLLTVILGCSDLLIHRKVTEESARPLVAEIHKAGERAAALTRQLLAFSRKQVLTPQVLDLNALVMEMQKMLRRLIGEHIVLTTALSPNLGRVTADPGQLEQVILNLAVNARDAMPGGGELRIETKNTDLDDKQIRETPNFRGGRHVCLSIRDNGCGMTREVLDRIFEPFFTTKERGKGTGLGLATVYGIVNQSQGHIRVESEPGKGTQFDVYLPRHPETVYVPRPERVLTPLPRRGKETVLLVEDEEPVRKLIGWVLESAGYTVLRAADPAEALQICKRPMGPIHLLLTDVVMPGMSGPDLAKRFLVMYPGSRVMYCTGYTEGALEGAEAQEPGIAILHKPFAPAALSRAVRAVLDEC
jgi:PAS domain S-box-containing protein